MKSLEEMNITSFSTSLEADRMANIDSSSTTQLTPNSTANSKPMSDSRGNSNSDSEIDGSLSVSVLKPDGNSGKPFPYGSKKLYRANFSLSNCVNKHQGNVWKRMNRLERALSIAVALLVAAVFILLLSLIDIAIDHRRDLEKIEQLRRENERLNPSISTNASSTSLRSLGQDKSYCMTPDCVKVAASVIEAIDLSADPCDDFYMFSCGDWIKSHPLPDGKSNWGTFSKLWQDNQSIMRSVLGKRYHYMWMTFISNNHLNQII